MRPEKARRVTDAPSPERPLCDRPGPRRGGGAGAGTRAAGPQGPALERLRYHNPGLVVDLGVGLWAWPLPMDYDGDGDLDLVVSCPDTPCNGTYLFENPGGDRKFPVFKAPVRIAPGLPNVRPSYVGGAVRVLTPAHELVDFRTSHLEKARPIYPTTNLAGPDARLRANQWQLADVDDDGRLDLVVDSRNATVLRNAGAGDGFTTFRNGSPLAARVLAGHSTCPTVVDWDTPRRSPPRDRPVLSRFGLER
jgi:hypothetical protein